MKQLFYVLMITASCFSCNKDNTTLGKNVEIYLLKSYTSVTNKCQVDAALSVIEDLPAVSNNDILSYSLNDYEFELKDDAISQIKLWKDKTPFAVTADRKVIYFGFFKPGTSSSSCDNSITMDISWTSAKKIMLRLGYPSVMAGSTIDDRRNHPNLIASLSSQGKIK